MPNDLLGFAVFLDIDGTLLDIADRPDAVIVPPGLGEDLAALAAKTEGALALVTGRPLEVVDALFPNVQVPVSALHGSEWRDGSGREVRVAGTPDYLRAKERLKQEVALWPGVIFEDKGAAFAAHYRLAREREEELRALMSALNATIGSGWVLQEGKSVIELRPRGSDKGDALRRFMALDAFGGRRPLAVGDDVTDETMFAEANALGGLSVRVGLDDRETLAACVVSSPAQVRDWIQRIAA